MARARRQWVLEEGGSSDDCTAVVAFLETVIDGRKWVQQPFPYQAKCLNWLRQDYQALAPDRRAVVDKALAGTGCEVMFGGL